MSVTRRFGLRAVVLAVALVVGAAFVLGGGSRAQAQGAVSTSVPAGISLIGWCGGPTTSGAIFDQYPLLDTIWAFDNPSNAYDSDSVGLPPTLRNDLAIRTGAGLFVRSDGAFNLAVESVDYTLPVASGLNLIAQCGFSLSSDDLFFFYPDIETVWTLAAGASQFASDSQLLPAPLRTIIEDIPAGSGMFVKAGFAFPIFETFEGDGDTPDQGNGDQTDGGDGDATPPSFDDLRIVGLGTAPAGISEFTVTVQEGEGSFLFSARSSAINEQIAIVQVLGPSGEDMLVTLEFALANSGEVSALIPMTAATPLPPGEYTISVEANVATTGSVIFKRATNGVAQVMDVTIWVATSSDEVADAAGRATVEQIWRNTGAAVFSPFGLSIGRITFRDPSAAVVQQYATLSLPTGGPDTALRELCSAIGQDLGEDRTLHFVLVDRIVDPADLEGITLGIAAGLPGATVITGTNTSCVVVSGNDADFGVTVAGQATTAWHEAGHLLGLSHTSESDGTEFDFIADTPECPISFDTNGDGTVERTECPDGENFMFHNTEGTDASLGQAFLMRGNPLFRPTN